MPKAEFVRTEPGRHHSYPFNVYQVEYKGHRIEFKTKITDAEYLYTMRLL